MQRDRDRDDHRDQEQPVRTEPEPAQVDLPGERGRQHDALLARAHT